MKKVEGSQSVFRKVRGVSDKTIQEALTNHQAVLKQLIGAYTEQQAQLKAVEEILKGMLEGMVESELPVEEAEHGRSCGKLLHDGEGYLHNGDDDRPYDVDGVMYCGRCHEAIFAHAEASHDRS